MGSSNVMKYGSLCLLVVQTTIAVLVMRASRMGDEKYFSSTAILLSECFQVLVCLAVVRINQESNEKFFHVFRHQILGFTWSSLQIMIPACLYTIQNNLLFHALSNLDAATYQASYQLKILTTAFFSTLMLQRHLGWKKWTSLFVLVSGVVVIQFSLIEEQTRNKPTQMLDQTYQNPLIGFLCILGASCTSGFSGVFFEKILKTTEPSLWVRNAQMCLFSIIPAMCSIFFLNSSEISEKGFFYGYNSLVCLVIFLQATSGIVISIVVKYADNILKGFASSLSIVLCSLASFVLYNFNPSFHWLIGATLVVSAACLYNLSPGGMAKVKSQ